MAKTMSEQSVWQQAIVFRGELQWITCPKSFDVIAFLHNAKLHSVPVDLCQMPYLLVIRAEGGHTDGMHHVAECFVRQHGHMTCMQHHSSGTQKETPIYSQ